jgi:hypothetical protein
MAQRVGFVNAVTEEVSKPVKGQPRRYLLVQNASLNDIYIAEGSHANINNGITIGAGQSYERSRQDYVPQEFIFIQGSVAAPALQQINITDR